MLFFRVYSRKCRSVIVFVGIAAAFALFAMSCSSSSPKGPSATVEVQETDTSVLPNEMNVAAGRIDFKISNAGGDRHELVVLKTDIAAANLPVVNNQVPENSIN